MTQKNFWDIEAYKNLFCAGFLNEDDFLEMHYIVESKEDEELVERACKDSGYKYKTYNLKENTERLAEHFDIRKPTENKTSLLSEFLGVKDKEIPKRTEEYFAFNSLHYDIPMIDFLLSTIVDSKVQTTLNTLRKKSDEIIFGNKYFNTSDYELYGNQIDVSYLDDKLHNDGKLVIGLKTLVGLLGGKILESESNKTGYSKDIYGDVLYNINDIKELRDTLFRGSVLESTYNNRKELMNTYPALRANNITLNKTTAKFVEYIVSPDKPITDSPVVSFMYPAKHIADKLGIKQFDVLEYAKEWYIKNVYMEVRKHNPYQAKKLFAKFYSIYNLYSYIRGKNWNESRRHFKKYGIKANTLADRAKLTRIYGTFLPFVDKYGNISSTYVNFSIGGIHGAEYNAALLDKDRQMIKDARLKYGKFSKLPSGELPQALKNIAVKQSRSIVKDFSMNLSHEIPEFYNNTTMIDDILDPEELTPFLIDKKGKEALLDRYKYTSYAHTIHQDFSGYYPMLLINLGVFYDGNGRDTYKEVYDRRIGFKNQLKELIYGSDEYKQINLKQDGLKLVVNSASGILDGSVDTNLRANNKAMSMRIIGQLFTFIIAQALAIEGAHIPSSNTDGIYVSNIDIETNKRIVNRELEKLLVDIDPEHVLLVSKDTNTRVELENGQVVSAKGGSVTEHGGATVRSRNTKPTLIDKLLVMYISEEGNVDKDFDSNRALELLKEYRNSVSELEFLKMAAWVMRPTSGSIFITEDEEIFDGTIRSFLVKEGIKLKRFNTTMTKASVTMDEYVNELSDDDIYGEPEAVKLVTKLNLTEKFKKAVTVDYYKNNCDFGKPNNLRSISVPTLKKLKISNLSDNMSVTIENDSLLEMDDELIKKYYNQLDLDAYVEVTKEAFSSWQNTSI